MGQEMSKKILVCGAAGFLMSNFIRYVLYRTKDYKFVGIDNLSANDMKNVYTHRHSEYTKFCLGNINDKKFMDHIIQIEKPDIIVNGASPKRNHMNVVFDHKKVLDGLISLSRYDIPIIQPGWPDEVDSHGVWNLIRNIVIRESGGTYLAVPNCFGMRQKGCFSNQIKEILSFNQSLVCSTPLPWVYAEDVSSLLWFLIENRVKGQVKMPPLKWCSLESMTRIIASALKADPHVKQSATAEVDSYNNSFWEPIVVNYSCGENPIPGWQQDSNDIEDVVAKTAKWYSANRWALGI